jgi:hypothetical protein
VALRRFAPAALELQLRQIGLERRLAGRMLRGRSAQRGDRPIPVSGS